MQIIRLPSSLHELDVASLNLRLHAGELCLDWTDVEPGIFPTHLEHLFVWLNLADSIDAVGSDTISVQLLPEILLALQSIEAQFPKQTQTWKFEHSPKAGQLHRRRRNGSTGTADLFSHDCRFARPR